MLCVYNTIQVRYCWSFKKQQNRSESDWKSFNVLMNDLHLCYLLTVDTVSVTGVNGLLIVDTDTVTDVSRLLTVVTVTGVGVLKVKKEQEKKPAVKKDADKKDAKGN